MAVKNQHIQCVRALLVAGANANGDARSLCSPLYIAAMNGYKDILEVWSCNIGMSNNAIAHITVWNFE